MQCWSNEELPTVTAGLDIPRGIDLTANDPVTIIMSPLEYCPFVPTTYFILVTMVTLFSFFNHFWNYVIIIIITIMIIVIPWHHR